jgi:hypothetical protein
VFQRIHPLLWLMLAALLAGIPSMSSTAPTIIQIDHQRSLTLNGPFRGLGAQDDTNLLWSSPNQAAGANVPDDFDTYIAPRLQTMRLPFVRKFIDMGWYAPEPGVYTWESPAMQALYRNLAVHQANDTRVLLTIWVMPRWLAPTAPIEQDSELQPAAAFPDRANEARWAETVVALLRHLYGMDGSGLAFDNVTYLGAPNELAGTTIADLARPLVLLRDELRRAGLSDRVTLFGPDAFVEDLLIARTNRDLDSLFGLYDFHYYAPTPLDEHLIDALDRLKPALAGSERQLWLTEFGELTRKNDDWRSLPPAVISGINGGLAAMSIWNLQDQIYNTTNIPAWGLWEVYDQAYRLKPAAYAWALMSAHIPPDATVYGHNCERNQCTQLQLAALGDAQGHRTVIAYNPNENPTAFRIDFGAVTPQLPLYRYTLNPAALPVPERDPLLPTYDRIMQLEGSQLQDELPPGTLAVYATYRPTHPASLATGQPVAASSVESPAYPAAFAVDGDPATRWSSSFSDPQTLTLDLQTTQTIRTIQILWEAAYAHTYRIAVSDDGRQWATIFTTDSGKGDLETIEIEPIQARYVRITGLQRATAYGYSIRELSIWP